jgi:hypothetical protein
MEVCYVVMLEQFKWHDMKGLFIMKLALQIDEQLITLLDITLMCRKHTE